MIINEKTARLTRPTGFIQAFEEELAKHRTMQQAYYAVEAAHEKAFGYTKYADFDSFRVVRARILKKRNTNKM